ncbi:MAG: MFS transporter, partial [Oscillospiraceae bacterium]
SKGNAVINLMGALGGAMMLGIIKFTVPETDHPNYMPLFVITAVFMAVCVIILFFTVSEPKAVVAMRKESKALGIDEEPELDSDGVEKKGLPKDVFKSLALIVITVFFFFMGYNAVTTAFSKYCEVVWGMKGGSYAGILLIATIASIVSYIPVGFIASKIGRKNTILVGLVLLAIAFGSATLFAEFSPAVYFFFCLAGIGYAFIIVNTLVMVVEMSRGSTIGKYTGYYYTLSMTAQIITPIASGAVLQFVGYQYLFPYAVVFEILAFVAMLFVKHGDSRPGAPKNKLEAFDIKD